MKRDLLEKPFDGRLIKQRPGPSGRPLNYVAGAEYIKRLNDAFDGEWSFEILTYKILDGECLVQGKISAGGLTKEAFGGHKRAGELGDDLKAAATDSLKKAASLFGVGLHLYTDHPQAEQSSAPPPTRVPIGKAQQITQRQYNAAQAISRSLGWTADQLSAHCEKYYKAAPEGLDRAAASELIGELQRMAAKEAG